MYVIKLELVVEISCIEIICIKYEQFKQYNSVKIISITLEYLKANNCS